MALGAATLADITSSSWSLMLDRTAGGAPGAGIGNIVQALDDINQCISIILLTHPGEDPLRPTFGLDMHLYLDKPLPVAQSALIGVVTNAISIWEPRVSVTGVRAQQPRNNPGALQVTVDWVVNVGVAAPSQQVFGVASQQSTTVIFV